MHIPDSMLFAYFIIPLLIVLARIIDVSLGTLKIIFIARGNRLLAPILGFFEVLFWLVAVSQILKNFGTWYYYIAYAFGFALGSFIGMKIEERLAIGMQLIRIITRKEASKLIESLKKNGYVVTVIDAWGNNGKVGILYSIVNRKDIPNLIHIIKELNPNAFYTIEDLRFVSQQIDTAGLNITNKKQFQVRR